jgi:hypothetical protein
MTATMQTRLSLCEALAGREERERVRRLCLCASAFLCTSACVVCVVCVVCVCCVHVRRWLCEGGQARYVLKSIKRLGHGHVVCHIQVTSLVSQENTAHNRFKFAVSPRLSIAHFKFDQSICQSEGQFYPSVGSNIQTCTCEQIITSTAQHWSQSPRARSYSCACLARGLRAAPSTTFPRGPPLVRPPYDQGPQGATLNPSPFLPRAQVGCPWSYPPPADGPRGLPLNRPPSCQGV